MGLLFRFGLVISVGITSSLILLILLFLLYFSFPLLSSYNFLDFFTLKWDDSEGLYGLAPMIVGTLYISLMATFIATLSSFSFAALIAYFLPKKVATILRNFTTFLAGVPTILYAFVGLSLLVPLMNEFFDGKGLSILSASFVLSFVILPTMTIMLLNSFSSVPKSTINAAKSLGATKEDIFFTLIMSCSKKGILSAIIFGFARAVGDTLIALMIAGNTLLIPSSILDSARTLSAHIALINANDYESVAFKAVFLSALLLFIFTLIIVFSLKLLNMKSSKK